VPRAPPRPLALFAGPGPGVAPAVAAAAVAQSEPTRVRLELQAGGASPPDGGLVASLLCDDGGWRVLADGVPAAAGSAGAFVTAAVPAGARRVELVHRPPGFLAGLLAAALACATGLVWCWPSAGGPQRRPHDVR
jgi:hypothetical protein